MEPPPSHLSQTMAKRKKNQVKCVQTILNKPLLGFVGPFYVDGPGPICYSKACELMGKGVGTGLLGVTSQASFYASQACLMLRQLGVGTIGGHGRYD